MNIQQPYFLPISFTPLSTPANSPSRKCIPIWTPENERSVANGSYYVSVSNVNDQSSTTIKNGDAPTSDNDSKHKPTVMPFPATYENGINAAQQQSNQSVSAAIPIVPVPMTWNCPTYEYGYEAYDYTQQWIPACFSPQRNQYIFAMGANDQQIPEYTEAADENRIEDDFTSNLCLTGPGPPIITSKKIKGPRGCNLFVFHLPNEITNWDLYLLFRRFGTILSAQTIVHRITGLSKGFGFVSFSARDEAQAAIAEMNGFRLGKKRLKVQLKRLQNESEEHATDGCDMQVEAQSINMDADSF